MVALVSFRAAITRCKTERMIQFIQLLVAWMGLQVSYIDVMTLQAVAKGQDHHHRHIHSLGY